MPACDACEGTGQVGGTTDRCIICNGLGSVPDEGPPLTLAPTPFVRPGDVVMVQVNDPQGARVVGRVTNFATSGTSVSVRPTSQSWVRTGQTAYLVGSNPQRRVQIVGVTERVEAREWLLYGRTSELGPRCMFSLEQFQRDWRPYYNSNQTQPGHRYIHVPYNDAYEVVRETPGQFVLTNSRLGAEVILDREGADPATWLYVGPPAREYHIPGRTTFTGITMQRTMPTEEAPPLPLSRFDRDDIV